MHETAPWLTCTRHKDAEVCHYHFGQQILPTSVTRQYLLEAESNT